jgi:hypothetical protein
MLIEADGERLSTPAWRNGEADSRNRDEERFIGRKLQSLDDDGQGESRGVTWITIREPSVVK